MVDLSPNSFESAMSHLVAGVTALEQHAPTNSVDQLRLDDMLMRLDRLASKSAACVAVAKMEAGV